MFINQRINGRFLRAVCFMFCNEKETKSSYKIRSDITVKATLQNVIIVPYQRNCLVQLPWQMRLLNYCQYYRYILYSISITCQDIFCHPLESTKKEKLSTIHHVLGNLICVPIYYIIYFQTV